MEIEQTKNGYVKVELTQQDCEALSVAARLARQDPPPGFDTPLHLSLLEWISSNFKVLAILASLQVNICDPDLQDHLAHMQESPFLSTLVQ